MQANQDPVPPFSPEVRSEFYEWIRHPDHTNQRFLCNPGFETSNKIGKKDLRSQVHGYRRLDIDPTKNTLWRLRDSGHSKDWYGSRHQEPTHPGVLLPKPHYELQLEPPHEI